MEPTLPTIEDLHDRLAKITLANYGDDGPSYFEVYRIHAQAMLLVAQELEQINNNLEALRKPEDNISKEEWETFKADLRSRGM